MRILILNQAFYPDAAATAQHAWDLARYLVGEGHQVTALTSRNVYGTDRPIGEAFERIGSVAIHRVGGTAFGKHDMLGRLADAASFYLAAANRLRQLPRHDVILALTSPPMVSALAMLHKQFRIGDGIGRTRFVYHVMDLFPDAAIASGVIRQGGTAHRVLTRLTQRTLDSADAVIAVGRDMRERLVREYGRRGLEAKLHVVPPWADSQELYPLDKRSNGLARELDLVDTFNVVYSGSLGVAHDVKTLLESIAATRDWKGLRWVFASSGRRIEELRQRVRTEVWDHVRVLPYQDRRVLNETLNLADVHIVSQLPTFTGVVVPSKLFGSMAVGRPTILVGSEDSECGRILLEHRAGTVVPCGDVQALVQCIETLRGDLAAREAMGRAARAALQTLYDRPIACSRIERILTGAVQGPDEACLCQTGSQADPASVDTAQYTGYTPTSVGGCRL
jgi:colanic acid biosynthesis glycosyl transferase WcaI